MSRVGIIGTGSMGSMLARKFAESGKVAAGDVFLSNRTPGKMNELAESYGFTACRNNREAAGRSDLVFICVKPGDVRGVLEEIEPYLGSEKTIVSVASDITLKKLSEWSGIPAARVIPSITSESMAGISVIVPGEDLPQSRLDEVVSLFSGISSPYVTTEDKISLLSDITSSSPAIIASIIQQYAFAAARRGGISTEDALLLVTGTFTGTAKLVFEKNYDFDYLISRVATKGGITAEGIRVVEKEIPGVFDEVFSEMAGKHLYTENISEK